MQFLVDELKSLKVFNTDNLNEVTKDIVCNFNSKDCMYNNCNVCSEIKIKVDNSKLSDKASWFTWVLKDYDYEKQGEQKKIKKMIKIKKEDHESCIHIDFSENFTCKYHKEIQSMHFIKEQITLHTGLEQNNIKEKT
ncbi:unnamed protein product [Leptidea sinapis]|uniref:Uncharacterized protein n=1 Tax=Leptidea sinapis TaxID=189913 RepID=A0A5E4QMP5_9NEOP|nr:unnamed protein product [Leptidea sinapis]